MDRMIRSSRTAPIKLETPMGKQARLLGELEGYSERLKEARSPIFAKRRKAREKGEAATKTGKVDLPAAVGGAFTEITTDAELADLYRWRYTVRKLKACAGVLDANDAELIGLRKFMRSLK